MVDDEFTQPKMFFLSDHCISFLIRTVLKDFRARESAQKEGIHGLPRAQDGQPPQWARTLQEQMFNARGAERRPHVADQEATGVTLISHLLLFMSFIHSFIYFFPCRLKWVQAPPWWVAAESRVPSQPLASSEKSDLEMQQKLTRSVPRKTWLTLSTCADCVLFFRSS